VGVHDAPHGVPCRAGQMLFMDLNGFLTLLGFARSAGDAQGPAALTIGENSEGQLIGVLLDELLYFCDVRCYSVTPSGFAIVVLINNHFPCIHPETSLLLYTPL